MDVGGRSYPLPIYLRNGRRVCGTLLRNRNSNTPNVIPACFKTRVTFHQIKKFALVVCLRESHVSLQFQLTKRTKQAIVALTGRYVPILSPPLILTHGCLSSFADFAGLSFFMLPSDQHKVFAQGMSHTFKIMVFAVFIHLLISGSK